MRRRTFLGLAAGATGALAGCTASALPSPDLSGDDSSTGCPAVLEVDRRVCPGSDGPLTIERSSAVVSGDDWSLVIAVGNGTDGPVGLNPYGWSVFRRTGDGWTHVAPDVAIEPWLELAPGAGYAWQLTAGADGLEGADQRVTLDLEPGAYAFAIPLRAAERLGAVAPFEVDG